MLFDIPSQLLFPVKSSENLVLSDDFRGNRSCNRILESIDINTRNIGTKLVKSGSNLVKSGK